MVSPDTAETGTQEPSQRKHTDKSSILASLIYLRILQKKKKKKRERETKIRKHNNNKLNTEFCYASWLIVFTCKGINLAKCSQYIFLLHESQFFKLQIKMVRTIVSGHLVLYHHRRLKKQCSIIRTVRTLHTLTDIQNRVAI